MKTEIPQWVNEYNNANYQSSAGRAVKITTTLAKELKEENERLKECVKSLLLIVDRWQQGYSDPRSIAYQWKIESQPIIDEANELLKS